jgi:hypothetical protein
MGKGQCYEVVTSVSLLTIRELMVKTGQRAEAGVPNIEKPNCQII